MKLTPEIIVKELEEAGTPIARMVGASKSAYRDKHPQNVVIFNANLIDKKLGKVWYGDLDLTKDAQTLINVAKKLKTTFYILREMDARFDNEDKSVKEYIKKSQWNTNQFVPIYDENFKIVEKKEK